MKVRAQLFDVIHRAGVISMLGLTAFGAVLLTARTYRYFTRKQKLSDFICNSDFVRRNRLMDV